MISHFDKYVTERERERDYFQYFTTDAVSS